MTDNKARGESSESKRIDGRCPDGVRRAYRPGLSERHQRVVAALVAAGYKTTGFCRDVIAATGCSFDGDGPVPTMQPDAFVIDTATQTVIVAEVEVSHPIDDEKWSKLEQWHGELASVGWNLRLFTYGSDGGGCEMDIYTRHMTEAEFERVRQAMMSIPGFMLRPEHVIQCSESKRTKPGLKPGQFIWRGKVRNP